MDGSWAVDVLPATLAVGLGAGIAFNPLLLAAMSGVAPERAGLASGVVNTAFMMGGALGLAVLVALSEGRTQAALAAGAAQAPALTAGYQAAFIVATVAIAAAAALSALLVRNPQPNERKEAWAK